ncbi:hypothetical protein [Myroides odoratus]|uniref:hypothetical protein n=1 Tax=Myroides odoratus TaxID=256 RepID=UPI0039B03E36
MKIFICFVATLFVVTACTMDKTDYESETNTVVPDHQVFKEVISFTKEHYTLRIEAINGHFYQGYNEVHLQIVDTHTKQAVENAAVSFLPTRTTPTGGKDSCPNLYHLVYQPQEKIYKGFSVFTTESNVATWEITINFEVNQQIIEVKQPIVVEKQVNKNLNLTEFEGKDQETYILALVAPIKPKVAENELIAGLYKYNAAADLKDRYQTVTDYKLLLDPRMPEPSMGNHSSPNNKDLVQKEGGFYYGVVNYTMTGNWTLNFILQNQQGRILRGTKVPTDFTPGIEGVKSELHIDILF